MPALVVLTAMPDVRSAERLAARLVREKLAACVSIIPGVRSVYHWKGRLEKARETVLLIKTSRSRWKAVEKLVLGDHPYELPELVSLPVTAGSKKYLDWIQASVR